MGSLLLKLIIEQINHYVISVRNNGTGIPTILPVVLGNIATSELAGGNNTELNEKVIVSLVNIAEESTLKNKKIDNRIDQQHFESYPILHINLYLLFVANFSAYPVAVDYLFRVLEFFQGRKIFKFKNAPLSGIQPNELRQIEDIELIVELHTLSFEQLNDLWGSLGGKQMPFVLYRARLVPIMIEQPLNRSGLITEIDLSSRDLVFNP